MLACLTCGVAATRNTALSRHLLVEASLTALTVPSLGVSLTVDTVQTLIIPQTVTRSAVTLTTNTICRSRGREVCLLGDLVQLSMCFYNVLKSHSFAFTTVT